MVVVTTIKHLFVTHLVKNNTPGSFIGGKYSTSHPACHFNIHFCRASVKLVKNNMIESCLLKLDL